MILTNLRKLPTNVKNALLNRICVLTSYFAFLTIDRNSPTNAKTALTNVIFPLTNAESALTDHRKALIENR